jgi:putative DNA primase/helicase
MYGILNASHSKINAYVWRCVGEDHEPKPFNVFAPQAIGMIGHPRNDALLSRCIVINMKRKTQDEQITMFNANLPLWEELRGKLGKWAHDQQEALSLLEPKSLNSGDDR